VFGYGSRNAGEKINLISTRINIYPRSIKSKLISLFVRAVAVISNITKITIFYDHHDIH
jgi:hypothetical protein